MCLVKYKKDGLCLVWQSAGGTGSKRDSLQLGLFLLGGQRRLRLLQLVHLCAQRLLQCLVCLVLCSRLRSQQRHQHSAIPALFVKALDFSAVNDMCTCFHQLLEEKTIRLLDAAFLSAWR